MQEAIERRGPQSVRVPLDEVHLEISPEGFDETFEASLAAPSTIVTRATPQQAALWLMAAERIRADRQKGSVNLFGTPYWNDALTEHAGKLLTVRFDPDDLHKPVRVYDAENRLICIAEPEERARFDDTQAARVHSRKRREFMKAKQEQARLHHERMLAPYAQMFSHRR